MDRERDEGLADGTGMDRPDDGPAMPAAKELTRSDGQTEEASGGEKAAVEGLSGLAATHAAFGGGSAHTAGGIGTHLIVDGDDHEPVGPDQDTDSGADPGASTDPRGY
jgi:hypothetical protein